MLTDVLLARPWLAPTGLVVLVLLGPWAGAWLLERDRTRWAWLLAAASTVPVALVTLVPVDRELFARCTVQWALPTLGRVELLANVLLFVAPVLFAGVAAQRPVLVLLAASGLSAAVETTQALVVDLGRSCDTTDWLSNTIGAGLGAGLAAVALVLHRRSSGAEPER